MSGLKKLSCTVLLTAAVLGLGAGSAEAKGEPELVQLQSAGAGGLPVRAYVAGPRNAKAGVLILHDYFGMSAFTRGAADRLGGLGYRVVVVDLYGEPAATTSERAVQLMQGFQSKERPARDRLLQAGLDELKRPGRRVATLGFSMGGFEALQANLNDPQAVQASVIVYGGGFDGVEADRLARLRSPVLVVTGARDEGSLQASLNWLKRTGEVSQPLESLILPGVGHAYAQPLFDGGKGYSPEATRVTWQAIDAFLARHLGGPR